MFARVLVLAVLSVAQAMVPIAAARAQTAEGTLIAADGAAIGSVRLTETPHGVLIAATAEGLPPGPHAFHIHAVGACQTPDFTSAGGHFNPTGAKHGILSPDGMHAGDLPNVHVAADGTLNVEVLTQAVTLNDGPTSLFDEDGASLVIHANADDYRTDPTGEAGGRIACAVIEAP